MVVYQISFERERLIDLINLPFARFFVLARSPLEPMCEGQGTCNSLPVV